MGSCGSKNMVPVKEGPEAAPIGPTPSKATRVIVASDVNQQQSSQPPPEQEHTSPTTSTLKATASDSQATRPIASDGDSSPRQPVADDDDDDDDDDAAARMASATSTRSAPSVMQRPSSRGGAAFELSWDGEGGANRMPRRLERLQQSSQRRKGELTLDQLQQKLEAAEKRKQEYEQRIKQKMAGEISKAKGVPTAPERNEELENRVSSQEDKAEGNREQHLKMLRERLRAKEEHARKVREKKKLLQQQEPAAEAS